MEEILKQILNEMQDMKLEMKDMKTQISENTQMLKSIHHSVEVQKAGQDKVLFDIAEIKGNIKGIRNDLNTVEIVTSQNWNEIAKIKSVK